MTIAPSEFVNLHFAWSPPSGRVKAAYRAEVIEYQAEGDRYVCRLVELIAIERGGARVPQGGFTRDAGLEHVQKSRPGEEVSDDILRGLIGKRVRVPGEALSGMVLPLKMATLTGGLARPYFYDAE